MLNHEQKLAAKKTSNRFLNKSVVVVPYKNNEEEGIIFPNGISAEDLINLI